MPPLELPPPHDRYPYFSVFLPDLNGFVAVKGSNGQNAHSVSVGVFDFPATVDVSVGDTLTFLWDQGDEFVSLISMLFIRSNVLSAVLLFGVLHSLHLRSA